MRETRDLNWLTELVAEGKLSAEDANYCAGDTLVYGTAIIKRERDHYVRVSPTDVEPWKSWGYKDRPFVPFGGRLMDTSSEDTPPK